MKTPITDERYEEIMLGAQGCHLTAIWYEFAGEHDSLEDEREEFLSVLERALTENRMALKKDGQWLTGTPVEQVERFRLAFPRTRQPFADQPDMDVGHWFYSIYCPGEVYWPVERDGQINWVQG